MTTSPAKTACHVAYRAAPMLPATLPMAEIDMALLLHGDRVTVRACKAEARCHHVRIGE